MQFTQTFKLNRLDDCMLAELVKLTLSTIRRMQLLLWCPTITSMKILTTIKNIEIDLKTRVFSPIKTASCKILISIINLPLFSIMPAS